MKSSGQEKLFDAPISYRLSLIILPQTRLVLCTLASAILYFIVLVLPFPLVPLYDTPLLDLGKIAHYEASRALTLLIGYALIFGLYILAYRAAAHLHAARYLMVIIGSALVFSLILIWVYPIGAVDIYDYIFRARLWGVYDFNPLTVAPIQVSDDPWYPYVVWVWFASPYGPLWTYISLGLFRLAGDQLLNNLFMFKLLPSVCIVGSALILYDLQKDKGAGRALSGVLLFSWNPLLLFESMVNGHNDIVMMTCVLMALWLYHRRRRLAAVIFCLLAASLKIAALVVLPVLLLACMQAEAGVSLRAVFTRCKSWQFLLMSIVTCTLISVALYAPLWRGLETLAGLTALNNRFTSSLAALAKLSVESRVGTHVAEQWGRNLFGLIFLLIYSYQLLRTPARERALYQHIFAMLVTFVLVGTLWFQPWYIVWIVALAPLVDARRQWLTIVWSASALSIYLIFNFLWVWYADFFNTNNELVLNCVVVLAWLSPLIVSEVLYFWRVRQQQNGQGLIERWAP